VPNPLVVLSAAETAACCAPLSAEPLTMEQAEQVAPLLKALADPVRLRLRPWSPPARAARRACAT